MSFVEEYVVSQGTWVSQLAVGTLATYNCKKLIVSGGAAETTVHTGGTVTVAQEGAMSKTVLSGGLMSNSGNITETTVSNGGSMVCESGGFAQSTTVCNGGVLTTSDGSTVQSTTISNGGTVSLGGIVNNASNGGTAVLFGSASATELTVLNGGKMSVKDNSTVSGTVIESGGELTVLDSGVALNVILSKGGVVNGITHIGEENNASLDGVTAENIQGTVSDLEYASGTLKVAIGGSLHRVTVTGDGAEDGEHGVLYIEGGATASESLLLKNRASAYISNGAIVESLQVETNAYAELAGSLTSARIDGGGTLKILQSATADGIALSGGSLTVDAGGAVSYIEAESGSITISEDSTSVGYMTLNSGVKINDSVEILKDGGIIASFSDNMVNGSMTNVEFTGTINYCGTYGSDCCVQDGGTIAIFGGDMTELTVEQNGVFKQSSGTVSALFINGGTGSAVGSDVVLSNAIVQSGGVLTLQSVTSASNVSVKNATLHMLSNAEITSLTLMNATIDYEGYDESGTILSGTFRQGAQAALITGMTYLGIGGQVIDLLVAEGSTTLLTSCSAYGVSAGGEECSGALVTAQSETVLYEATVLEGGTISATSATIYGIATYDGGTLICNSCAVSSGGDIHFAGGRVELVDTTVNGAVTVYFDAYKQTAGTTYVIDDLSLLNENMMYIVVSEEMLAGDYCFAESYDSEHCSFVIKTEYDNILSMEYTIGDTVTYNGVQFTLCTTDTGGLFLKTEYAGPVPPTGLAATPSQLIWNTVHGVESYTVEFSDDIFQTQYTFVTTSTKVSLYGTPNGKYQWRVYSEGNTNYARGSNLKVTQATGETSLHLTAVSDSVSDVFFARTSKQYDAFSIARNQAYGLTVNIGGKNRFTSVFTGGTDTCYIVLTDSAAGDAFFLEDTLSDYPEDITDKPLRFSNIDEIYAGRGDDIVDLTTTTAATDLDGIILHGGDGNDILWGNQNAENTLMGDGGNDTLCGGTSRDTLVGGVGNDTMYGGGGDDLFAFGNGWGQDTIIQSATGSVTLWFESGDLSGWDAQTMAYTDGENTVKISGVTSDKVTLKFGADEEDARYAYLVSVDAFKS